MEPDLLAEALAWIVRLKAGLPTQADADALQHWRRSSPEHEAAFRIAVQAYRHGQTAIKPVLAAHSQSERMTAHPGRMTRRLVVGGAVAAATGSLVIRPPFDLWPSLRELTADYRSKKGEKLSVAISPGLSLELNTMTSLSLYKPAGRTEIALIAGEAEVDARLPADNPLILHAANGRAIASHAVFNASCLDGVVSLTCIEGTMRVEQAEHSIELRTAQQVTYEQAGLAAVRTADVAAVRSWQSGLLVVRDRPLSEVIEEVNRYRPGRIILTRPSLGPSVVSGTFQIDKLDDFVAQIEQLFSIKATYLPGGIVILR